MGEAAYNEAKAKGELLEQRLRKLADHWGTLGFEADLMRESADIIEWLSKERDSLIDEVATLERAAAVAVSVERE